MLRLSRGRCWLRKFQSRVYAEDGTADAAHGPNKPAGTHLAYDRRHGKKR